MFYPVDSLKKGGRFYLCWVADSWPEYFATITHRQLWSQDVRRMCDDLLEVMANESGHPSSRFSLRLSSQLLRGLVRLYQRKVIVLLSDICMINANVFKNTNKKFNKHEDDVERVRMPRPNPPVLQLERIVDEQEPEQRVEELIQNSGNVVSNIQDITLREAAIPEFRLPANDNFGEENPEQVLQQIADRTLEVMLAGPDASVARQSGSDLAWDRSHERSHDKSRLMHEPRMEQISEQDITMFRKSTGMSLVPGVDYEKEIPEDPDIPIPELSVPPEKQLELPTLDLPMDVELMSKKVSDRQLPIEEVSIEKPVEKSTQESEQIELEELEANAILPKRRRIKKLIVDRHTKIDGNVYRARIANPLVELRCEDSLDDVIPLEVPYDVFMKRPAHAGFKLDSKVASKLSWLFLRNLGVVNKLTRVEREIEEGVMKRYQRTQLELIRENGELYLNPQPDIVEAMQENIRTSHINVTMPQEREIDVPKDVSYQREEDIADMLTQKLETTSQVVRKRSSVTEDTHSAKRQRSIGYVSFRESQEKILETEQVEQVPKDKSFPVEDHYEIVVEEGDRMSKQLSPKEVEKRVTDLLKEAGLADKQVETEQPTIEPQTSRMERSASTETQLGSLDRTKVSLGDSTGTTDSMRFVREHWGTQGTMIKILSFKKRNKIVTVTRLVEKGPVMEGHKRIMAALCFTSILKLKQHGFIVLKKCPETQEILDVMLGPKFIS